MSRTEIDPETRELAKLVIAAARLSLLLASSVFVVINMFLFIAGVVTNQPTPTPFYGLVVASAICLAASYGMGWQERRLIGFIARRLP